MSRRSDVDVAIEAALAGAEVARARAGSDLVIHEKLGEDFATDADIAAEHAIRDVIRAHRPDDGVVGEELGGDAARGQPRHWLVDPLCGTVNYAAGLPLVAVNVALVDTDRVTCAAVADPSVDELFWTDGSSACVRREGLDQPLEASAATHLVCLDAEASDRMRGARLLADRDLQARYRPRMLSTTLALAWVAAGRMSAYVSEGRAHRSVHFAAGIALCEAVGCVVTDLTGSALRDGSDGLLVAADAATHDDLCELLARL
jgi:myo-inositol-1(or 4)-monophosphatase